MNIYDNNKELLATLGITGEFSTDFEVRKAILTALGGDASNVNSIYEADIKILDIYKNGGGAGGGDCSELEAQIQSLEAEVAALETENNTLEASNTQLESQIASISTLSVTENGTYTPEAGILGWNNVEVNVAGAGGGKIVLGDDIKLGYSSFREVPDYFDFSQTTYFKNMFYKCSGLTTIPSLDTSNGTDFSYMFNDCDHLITIPQIDTSNGTDFSSMFSECTNLTTIPVLDTSKGTYFMSMFYYCENLTTIPSLDTSKGTQFNGMFDKCKNIITIPQLDTSNGTSFYSMFRECGNLITITQLDISKSISFSSIFSSCTKLENITFVGSINGNIDFNPCPLLTYDSVKSILTACSNTTRTTASKTITFNRTLTDQDGELAALVSTCNSKGWTISGLTLN